MSIETTLDSPHVMIPSKRLASFPLGRSDANPRRDATASTERAPASRQGPETPAAAPTSDPSRTPSSASAATARASQFVPLVSAAALVVIAIAVIAFVMRQPAERQPSAAAPPPAAAERPSVAAAPAEANRPPTRPPEREPPVSVTDDVGQQTASARALYRAGKYDEAARAAGQVLKKAPGNTEAQRVMNDVARYTKQAATEAVSGLAAARARAEAAGAPSAASAAFARAVERERTARGLMAAGDHAKATTAAYEAQGLFEAAAAESVGRADTRAAAEPPLTRARPTPDEPRPSAPLPNVTPIPAPSAAPAPPSPPPCAGSRGAARSRSAGRHPPHAAAVHGGARGTQPASPEAGLARARRRAGASHQGGIRQRAPDQRHARLAAHPGVGRHRNGRRHATLFAHDGGWP